MMNFNERSIEVAKNMSNSINDMSFSNKAFCEQMSTEHRYLQSQFTQLCLDWIKTCAKMYKENRYDGRNELACKFCSQVVEKMGL